MHNIVRVARKELLGFFSSLTAFIFFGVFLGVTLFVFFWVDAFFARNIADVRPIFEWLPTLFVFLVPALTMRMWSEERRSGTLEFLLTLPLSNIELVLGKFLACMILVATALLLTLPLPISVAVVLGPLDWGPVIGGYIASLFLAGAYAAIGLYISARTENQIVSLLMSVLLCSLLLLVGSDSLTSLFPGPIAETMRLLGSGSRFQSISRGVIDFRDLYYYASIAAVFLCLNIWGLEKLRWAGNRSNLHHRTWMAISLLFIANFLAANFWLQQISWARADLTSGQVYSISPATRKYLANLKEPLLIRGYFSKKTHPLLAPLVPQLRDLLKEYALASNGKVHVEIVDPMDNPAIEKEAGEEYGIKPVPFETASKYQTALTSSYFDILIKYGDQFEKLGYRQLIEAKQRGEQNIVVDLRNPEYDITNAIRKVLYSYQGAGNPFLSIDQPVKFIGYVSADANLPSEMQQLKRLLTSSLKSLQKTSNGKFSYEFIEPEANGGKVAQKLASDFGFKPMALGLLDPRTFWFYMTMQSGATNVLVPLPPSVQANLIDQDLKEGLKHFSKGFLKTIGICEATADAGKDRSGLNDYALLKQLLENDNAVESVTLDNGQVPSNIDVLLLLSPLNLKDRELFAVDQFLMKGGTVIAATAPFAPSIAKTLSCRHADSGMEQWLKNYGIDISQTMVLDPNNFPLPIPAKRMVSGYEVEEMQLVPYPYFVDVRKEGMSSDQSITAGIDQIVMTWASPITLDNDKNKTRKITQIIQSSPGAWTSPSTKIQPLLGDFPPGTDRGKKLLAVALEGQFESFFKGKTAPTPSIASIPGASPQEQIPESVVERSADSAKLILFSSTSFLSDRVAMMASESLNARYFKAIQFLENCVDWSLGDRDLLSIRGRSSLSHVLRPIAPGSQQIFEYVNYALAALALSVVWFIRRRFRAQTRQRFEQIKKLADSRMTSEASST